MYVPDEPVAPADSILQQPTAPASRTRKRPATGDEGGPASAYEPPRLRNRGIPPLQRIARIMKARKRTGPAPAPTNRPAPRPASPRTVTDTPIPQLPDDPGRSWSPSTRHMGEDFAVNIFFPDED